MELSVGDKLSGVMAALKVSQNAKNDLDSRLHSIMILYRNISITSQYSKHPTVKTILATIVLESGNNSDSNWKYFQLKRYAFGCLEKEATCLSNAFFDTYYSYLKKQLNIKLLKELQSQKTFLQKVFDFLEFAIFLERDSSFKQCLTDDSVFKQWSTDNSTQSPEIELLDRYFYTCKATEKFRILKTLSIHIFDTRCKLNLSIFNEFQSKHWCKELLTYTLLSNNSTWSTIETSKLVREITNLDVYLKEYYPTYCIENILEIFITIQRKCGLDIGFIIKVLKLLYNTKSLDLISEDFCSLPNIFPQLEFFQLKATCNEQQIIYTNEDEVKELLYLLVYSDETVDCFLSKVKPQTSITKLIEFLTMVRDKNINRKEAFLSELKRNGSVEDWQKEFSSPLIESFIIEEFPGWKYNRTASMIRNSDKIYFPPNKFKSKFKPTTYCEFNLAEKNELREAIKHNNNKLHLHKVLYDLKKALSKLILMSEFSESLFEEVKKLIECLDSENKIIRLINALETLVEYDINISQCNAMKIIFNSTESNVEKNIHNSIIESFFPGTYEKSVEQLIDESVVANRKDDIKVLINKKNLMAEYRKVMNAYNSTGVVNEECGPIKNWDKSVIGKWSLFLRVATTRNKFTTSAERVKSLFDEKKFRFENPLCPADLLDNYLRNITKVVNRYERIAVIKRAMELTSKLKPRDVQLLSVLLLLNCQENKGRLAQINTGEGKTVTIGMLAAYFALDGYQVDVITSSKLLAIPQSEELEEFYNTLCLTVSHIFHSTQSYTADVIYGTSNEFQGDILRDEFRKSGCRHKRQFQVAIVDEVDNMLIDGNDHIVMLSSEMPAMDHLDTIFAAIYAQMKVAAGSVVVENGQTFFVERESVFDKNGKAKDAVIENHIPIEGTMRDFIMNSTELHIRNLIRDCKADSLSKDFPEIKIPKHLREIICKTELKKWVRRSIAAKFHYMIKEDYIMENNKIKIVDAENTGVIQQSMRWSHGLHEFLEIKHGMKVTSARLTSNYISNVSFFRRYKSNLYGLTGTLGCQATKNLLAKTYNLDFIIVPPFKFRQHKELSAIVVHNRDTWQREIVKSSLRKLCNDRAVLIIMEYIHETEKIEKIFLEEFGYDKKKVKLYKTDNDSGVVREPLSSGQVIITTNIAGRGTDIKLTNNVDKNGGLHVCITFLPRNSRVEEQNIGRTSRTGNCGTSQLILCSSEADIDQLRENRQQKEEEKLMNAEKEIEIVTAKDEVFQKFCHLTDTIHGGNKFVRDVVREAVEERFAIWLEMCTTKMEDNFNKSDFFKSFESFRKEILRDDEHDELIRNPYMFVKIGNKYLNDQKYKNAIAEYSSAIDMDPNFAEHAHYNRGYAYIAAYGSDLTKYKDFINEAIEDFTKARKLIQEKEHYLHLMQHASQGDVFINQISNKLTLYSIQKAAIDLAIGPDVNVINKQLEECRKLKDAPELSTSELENIMTNIKNLEAQKYTKGIIQKAQDRNRELKIETMELEKCLAENDQSHEDEIKQFKRNGAIGSFRISEIPPIDWVSVASLFALGVSQLIAGAALTIFSLGAGASFGMGLITEGISDIVTAVKDGIINRDFSWATWALEKAISLTVAVVCAGWKAMKDVAKTAYAGVKSAASIGSKVVTQVTKEGWKLVAKKIGTELGKEVGKEMVTYLADYGVNQTLIPLIQQGIIERVQGPIETALENNPVVKMMLEMDKLRNNRHYEIRIRTLGMDLLKPGISKNAFDLSVIAEKIANRIADKKVPGLTAARTVYTALEAVVELSTLTQNFISKLNESLANVAKKDKLEEKLQTLSKSQKEEEEVKKEESASQKRGKKTEGDIDLNLLHKEDEQAKSEAPPKDVKGVSKNFVDVISTTMINTIQNKLISPIIRAGVNYSVDAITSNVTKSLDKQTETYRSHRRVIHRQNIGYNNTKTTNEQNSADNEQRINKIEGLIEDLRSGGSAGLIHLGAMSDAINRPIQVYDKNGKLQYTIGETKPGPPAKVEYHEPKFGSEVGHYTLPNNKEPTGMVSRDPNMCLLNVVATQVGRDPNDLKNSTLQIMENNKSSMAKQVDDINRLEMFSKLRLAMGGTTYQGKCPDDAEQLLKESTNAKAFNINQPGHPLRHAPVRGTTDQKLEETSKQLKRKIVVYDGKGTILYTKGENFEGDPIELDYHKPAGDTSGEYFSPKGGSQTPYRLHDTNDKTFYNMVGKLAKHDADNLMSSVTKNINQYTSSDTVCVEDYSINYSNPDGPTGFLSQADMNYLTHHALQLQKSKDAMDRLNKLDFDKKLSSKQCREVVIISAKELGLSRPIYAQNWKNGQPTGNIKPATQFVMLLQHHEGKERDPNAPVHIHTIYPKF